MATAITYRTTGRRSDLRTVLVDEVQESVVLLPTGPLDLIVGKLLHGTTCRHEFWAEALGTDPDSDHFAVPAEQVVARREMQVAVRIKKHK